MSGADEGHGKHIPALEDIPEQLHEYIQFVCWRYVERDGRWTKPPINPRDGGSGDSSDSATWADVETALEQAVKLSCDGIGFVFTHTDPFCGIDLDHCLDSETGEITEQAAAIVTLLDSYTEISPSGTGLHIIVRGKPTVERQKGSGIEVYGWGHYITITGRSYGGAS